MFKHKILFQCSFDVFDPERDIFFTVRKMSRGKNCQRIPLGHREGWAVEFLSPPRRPSTTTEAPVRVGRLNGAEECYEKLLKRSEPWSLSRANKSRQQCDAPRGILKRGALGLIQTFEMRGSDSLTHEGPHSSLSSQHRRFNSTSTQCKSMFRKDCKSLLAMFFFSPRYKTFFFFLGHWIK